jgi:hypothetical protein
MSALAVRDLLQQEVENLSESTAAEVLDFVLFLKAKRLEEAFLWEQVEATQARRRLHPADVQTVSAEEWEALTAQLEIDD